MPAVGGSSVVSMWTVVDLPGAVRAEEAVDLAGRDVQVDPVDRAHVLELADEALDLDAVLVGHISRLPAEIRTTVENVSTQVTLEGVKVQAFIHFVRAHAAVVRGLDRKLVADHGLTINDYEVLIRL